MTAISAHDIKTMENPNTGRNALARDFDFGEFASAIASSNSGDEVWDLIDEICQKANMRGVCCRCFPSEAAAEQTIFFTASSNFSTDLGSVLNDTPGFLDPFLHASVRTTKPFQWEDIGDILESRSPQMHYFRDHIDKFGAGVVVPVFGPLFRNGYFCFHAREPGTVPELDKMVLHSISQTAYLKLLDVMYKTADRERTLSGRELEAINMIARGKSNPEVAEAMSVSVNTINTLLKRIFEKLDVSDRVSAVMRAYALGYIA